MTTVKPDTLSSSGHAGHNASHNTSHNVSQADYSNPGLPQIDSNLLLGTRKRMLIRHGDKRYLLRQTRRGKLILTGHEE